MSSNSFFKSIKSALFGNVTSSNGSNNLNNADDSDDICAVDNDLQKLLELQNKNRCAEKKYNALTCLLEIYEMYGQIDSPLPEDQRAKLNTLMSAHNTLGKENAIYAKTKIDKSTDRVNKCNLYMKIIEENIIFAVVTLRLAIPIVHGKDDIVTQDIVYGNNLTELSSEENRLRKMSIDMLDKINTYFSYECPNSSLPDDQCAIVKKYLTATKTFLMKVCIKHDVLLQGITDETARVEALIRYYHKVILIVQIALDNIEPIINKLNVVSNHVSIPVQQIVHATIVPTPVQQIVYATNVFAIQEHI